MTTLLVSIPVLLPMLAAGLTLALSHVPHAQRIISIVVVVIVLADAVTAAVVVDGSGPIVVQVGGYTPPVGIVLVADRLSALLLAVSCTVLLAVLVYAIGQRISDFGAGPTTTSFHPAYLVLTAGVALAYLTGDLFNLFVAFEVMLSGSYVLITRGVTGRRIPAAMTYVTTSLLSSLLFITLIALVYAATGTVNLAELGERVAGLDPGARTTLALLTVMVFGIKAAIVPLHFWLPDSYPTAPAPVTAVFAGLLTKVAVYAIIRTQTAVFDNVATPTVLLVLAALTMIVGVLGAIAQDDANRMMSFLLVSHIGFMLFGLATFNPLGMTGAILYIIHHITIQATLFLVLGMVSRHTATTSLAGMRAVAATRPVLGVLFALPALSLAGLPPFSGFVAKITLLRAGAAAGSVAAYAASAVLVVTSFLTLYALARVWVVAFWGNAARREGQTGSAAGSAKASTLACGALAAVGLGITVTAGPLSALSERASVELLDSSTYRSAVLGGGRP